MATISADDLRAAPHAAFDEHALRARAPHAVSLAVGASAITVRFEDAACAALFADRYADQLLDGTFAIVHYVVRTPAGYAFCSPGGLAWSWDRGALSPRAIVFLADATAISTILRSSSQLVSFHAAAVAYAGGAAAIAGDSTAGKTTTALACARRGMRLYSDERCVLAHGRVVPFARTLNLRADGLRRLARDRDVPDRTLDALLRASETSGEVRVRITTLFGTQAIAEPAELRAVFLLCGHAAEPRLEPASWVDVAPALLRWMDSADRGLPRVERCLHALRGVRCFRVVLGTPDASALLIRATLAAAV